MQAVDVGRVAAPEFLRFAHGHAAAQAFLADYLIEGQLVAVDVLNGEVAYAEGFVLYVGDYLCAFTLHLPVIVIDVAVNLQVEIDPRPQLFLPTEAAVGRGDDHQHHVVLGQVSVFGIIGIREHHARLEAEDILVKGDSLLHISDRQRGG